MLYPDTRAELNNRWAESGVPGSRTEVLNALVWAAPDDPDTFVDFVRLGRLRRRQARRESYDRETLADLEDRFS